MNRFKNLEKSSPRLFKWCEQQEWILAEIESLQTFHDMAMPLVEYLQTDSGYFNIMPGEDLLSAALSIIKGQRKYIEELTEDTPTP